MSELQKLFDTLVLYDYNIRILHWKVVGLDFGAKHLMMDEYHSELNSYVDEVGEMILMLHGDLPSFYEVNNRIMNNTEESFTLLSGNTTYDIPKVLETTRKMFTQLIDLYESAIKSEGLPGDIVNKLQEHQYWLRKETRYKLDSYLAQQ